MSSERSEWRFSQCFGDKADTEDLTDADIVSAVRFDPTGEYLATGDKGGRVVVFKRAGGGKDGVSRKRTPEYRFYTEFQSHEAEFDYLKSLEIEEKINQVEWCRPSNGALFLLSTNDKTVKLWKVHEKRTRKFEAQNGDRARRGGALRLPKVTAEESAVVATPRRVYANAHAYHINTIAMNSDGETFISVDDLRINLWNLGISHSSFNIVDIKPDNMEDLTEVITAADFHPNQCNIFAYSSSRGSIKLSDMRASALCDTHSKIFQEEEDPAAKSFFSEIIASISDVKFTPDGRYMVSRDYLTLKVWDINMEARPVKTINVHEHLRAKLCDLYENDCIFDKFELSVSGDGRNFVTGSYNNMFHVYDAYGATDVCIEASKTPSRRSRSALQRRRKSDAGALDFNKKALHVSWHPTDNIVAIAGLNNLYLYARA
mmetsp:Transcript_6001/g.19116  ORF Transcript_6001/g.19116 Transcript_6001/m.19116 type:complete len:431 (+) Transcript_6001:184-1476(+)|eukprot:CAMPEP_0196781036 /NCGR_PEP_ID=MMETSP1104-20130614/9013_1 /TAXON_ID=33652 /ORGANISM="Cafeteria sp., Strain Caron Lab Isolate" /LENGTH=430 /DNA_ID=CAMNT_0042151253 /DNA_START=179 /DNA_END=1471 /DNA_ORIENTATION=-